MWHRREERKLREKFLFYRTLLVYLLVQRTSGPFVVLFEVEEEVEEGGRACLEVD